MAKLTITYLHCIVRQMYVKITFRHTCLKIQQMVLLINVFELQGVQDGWGALQNIIIERLSIFWHFPWWHTS